MYIDKYCILKKKTKTTQSLLCVLQLLRVYLLCWSPQRLQLPVHKKNTLKKGSYYRRLFKIPIKWRPDWTDVCPSSPSTCTRQLAQQGWQTEIIIVEQPHPEGSSPQRTGYNHWFFTVQEPGPNFLWHTALPHVVTHKMHTQSKSNVMTTTRVIALFCYGKQVARKNKLWRGLFTHSIGSLVHAGGALAPPGRNTGNKQQNIGGGLLLQNTTENCALF